MIVLYLRRRHKQECTHRESTPLSCWKVRPWGCGVEGVVSLEGPGDAARDPFLEIGVMIGVDMIPPGDTMDLR